MKKWLTLFLLFTFHYASAQFTLGMTVNNLRSRYEGNSYLKDWTASVSNTGDSVITYRDIRDESVIASYLLKLSGQSASLTIASSIFGSADVFLPRFKRQCSKYTKGKEGYYVDLVNGVKYIIGVTDGVAFMRITLAHE